MSHFVKCLQDVKENTPNHIAYRQKIYKSHAIGNKTKGQISKRVFQENKARQIF